MKDGFERVMDAAWQRYLKGERFAPDADGFCAYRDERRKARL